MMRRLVLVLLLTVLPFTAMAIGVDERKLDDPQMEAIARDIMHDLRCLVCQNQSIEDSNAELAQDLRGVVRERVAAGDSPGEVRAYMVARYGDWVLLKPPFKASTLALWLGPVAFLGLAAMVGLRMVRRRRNDAPTPLSADEEARLNAILDRPDKPGGRTDRK
ncbi:MAG: cytochrome c-type biogenesis protein [Sphingomonadales bacterium]